MIVDFFRHGSGLSKGCLDYLLGEDREREHAQVLSGDVEITAQLIDSSPFAKVIVPVNFLEEEVEKAQFASAFGRFCGSEITLPIANDYGSKAANNAARMQTLFEKFDFTYTAQKATKDSFKVEMEAVQVASASGAGLAIVSASRDYGLDDIIFGPKELHLIKKSDVPLLLVNPRGDLYALCD